MERLHKHRLHSMDTQKGKTIECGNYSLSNYTSCKSGTAGRTLLLKGWKDPSAPAGTGLSSEHLHPSAGCLH